MVSDFQRSRPTLQPVRGRRKDTEVVHTYKYLGVHLDSKLDAAYRKWRSQLLFLRNLPLLCCGLLGQPQTFYFQCAGCSWKTSRGKGEGGNRCSVCGLCSLNCSLSVPVSVHLCSDHESLTCRPLTFLTLTLLASYANDEVAFLHQ